MKKLKKSSEESLPPSMRNSNPIAVLNLERIAEELEQGANNPDLVKEKAQELRRIAEEAFSILASIGSKSATELSEN
jgi:hypothetical protein